MVEKLNETEQFLLHLERNESVVYQEHPDYLLFTIVPFFQLVHVINTQQVIQYLLQFELRSNGLLIRLDGYLTLACHEKNIRDDELRRLTIQLLEIMRF